MMSYSQSKFEKSKKYIPGGIKKLTEKNYLIKKKSKGAKIWDEDNKEFIDYSGGNKGIILGYNYEKISSEIIRYIEEDFPIGEGTGLEIDYAELLMTKVLDTDQIKFLGSSKIAYETGIRLVEKIKGPLEILDLYKRLKDEKVKEKQVEKFLKKNITEEVGGIILDPIMLGILYNKNPKDILKKAINATREYDNLVVLDERKGAFRMGPYDSGKYYGVEGDIYIFGETLGGGHKLGAIAGKKEYMKYLLDFDLKEGESLSICAGYYTIKFILMEKGLYKELEIRGEYLYQKLNNFLREYDEFATLERVGSIISLRWKKELERGKEIMKILVDKGIIVDIFGLNYISYSHTVNDLDKSVDILKEVMIERNK